MDWLRGAARFFEEKIGWHRVGFVLSISIIAIAAWALYRKLHDMGFSIRAYYYESGMMYCGSWIDGDDQYFEIEECKADWVRENIPSDIDEYMDISSDMELNEECDATN